MARFGTDSLTAYPPRQTRSKRLLRGKASLLSLPLLAGLMHDEMGSKQSLELGRIPSLAAAFLDRVVEGAKPRWVAQELELDGTRISVPLLEYDQAFVHKERLRIATNTSGIGSGGRRPGLS